MASRIEKDLNPDVFIGISLPLNHNQEGFFKKTKTTLEQTKSNIKNLLMTIKGERLGNPTFGSDLMRILFEPNVEDLQIKIEESIRSSMDEFLPFVNIRDIKAIPSDRQPNVLNIRLQFSIDIDQTVETVSLDLAAADEVFADPTVSTTYSFT